MNKSLFSLVTVVLTVALLTISAVSLVSAHPHVVDTGHHIQELANGQDHSGFQPIDGDGLRNSCEGTLDSSNNGPAGYGLETAHHGPDAGTPGKADGCFATEGNPEDNNPAID